MTRADPDLQTCRALVVDANVTSRSTLVGMLREMGVGVVNQCARTVDARRLLEHRMYDVVICEQYFDQQAMNGQELLDELRRSQLLPFSTVFVMVTGEATYAKVAEAAESALDSYLLKPHNAEALRERVRQARHRKRVLKPIFDAIEQGRLDDATVHCMARFDSRGEFWLYAARIGAELLLRLNRHDDARAVFEAIRATRALPWARLGIARAEMEGGTPHQARRTLENLISANTGFADAYDVMGRVQVEQGDLGQALATYRRACEITPASITRLQKLGTLGFFVGEWPEAMKALERAMVTGLSSKMFDAESLLLLALMRFDSSDPRAFQRVAGNLDHLVEKNPDSRRLTRMRDMLNVLRALGERRIGVVVERIRDLAGEIRDEDFDFEAATNLIALLSLLGRTEVQLPQAEDWFRDIALRFCVSKAAVDLLTAATRGDETTQGLIAAAYQAITTAAEQAMNHSIKGAPDAAVRTLIGQGRKTLNAKLLELAAKVLQRYESRIPDHAELRAEVEGMLEQHCAKGTRISLNDNGRSPGGLALRLDRVVKVESSAGRTRLDAVNDAGDADGLGAPPTASAA
ncbi:response regulator [Leptothrix discophora]|uniref:Response regulator n=1 Tax=Leptothrix discophora TaxID=89 RepID=A0ABT9FYJ7_LEPDI|nr:response regulator [Leptothrix discophora]MDP4299220.1 response regulator [Leptothrix discophora]